MGSPNLLDWDFGDQWIEKSKKFLCCSWDSVYIVTRWECCHRRFSSVELKWMPTDRPGEPASTFAHTRHHTLRLSHDDGILVHFLGACCSDGFRNVRVRTHNRYPAIRRGAVHCCIRVG